jgi:hypothetical protein
MPRRKLFDFKAARELTSAEGIEDAVQRDDDETAQDQAADQRRRDNAPEERPND